MSIVLSKNDEILSHHHEGPAKALATTRKRDFDPMSKALAMPCLRRSLPALPDRQCLTRGDTVKVHSVASATAKTRLRIGNSGLPASDRGPERGRVPAESRDRPTRTRKGSFTGPHP
jgi:hypothetical protein